MKEDLPMKKRTATLLVAILVGIFGISLVGYAGAQSCAQSMPELLQEAGFKAFPGTLPQQQEYMKQCPKDTLMIHTKGGTTVYCYVDQATNTMYHGNEAEYQRLETLCQKVNMKMKEKKIENDPMFWNMWESSRGVG
jgi:hypothetical protein